ncbi:MAG: response regulator transcription factor, partial [Paracoccaceae bacterium]
MKLLIADDHDLVRDTIAAFLLAEGMQALSTAASLPDALALMRSETFDLVLLDYYMPGMNGLEGLARALAIANGTPVAVISGSTSRELAESVIKAGAAGYVPKTMAARAMVSAIRLMAAGEIFAPIGLLQSDSIIPDASAPLTKREADVLRGICEGKSNKEIARDLDLQ